MVNTRELKLPLSRTYFHGPEGVRTFEVLLFICSTGNWVSTAYVSKRKWRIAIKALATLFFISRLAVKGTRLFEVMIFQKICLKEKTNINKKLNEV